MPHMHTSVASVGLNLQLPKNPATNLPAWSFSFLLYVFLAAPPSRPPFLTRKEKLDHQWPASPQRIPLVDTLLMSPLLHLRSRSGQCASRPRMEVSQLILALLQWWSQWIEQLHWAASSCLLSHTCWAVSFLGYLLNTQVAIKSWLFSWSPENLITVFFFVPDVNSSNLC